MTHNQLEKTIVQEALKLFYDKGYHGTALSMIAKATHLSVAGLGEIFESKEAIALKVIALHKINLAQVFETFGQGRNPRHSLIQYLDMLVAQSAELLEKGCPYTSLYMGLVHADDKVKSVASSLLKLRLEWVEEQFRIMAKVDEAKDFANRLLSAIHGIIILSQATQDEHLLKSQINQLKSWIRLM